MNRTFSISDGDTMWFNQSWSRQNSSTEPLLISVDAVYYVKIILVSIISTLIVLSNVLNIYILSRDSNIPKIARIFLLNLSFSDLCVGLISCFPAIYSAIEGYWPYGAVWCQLSGIFHGTSCAISIWSISMVSIDRFLAICKPMTYPSWRSSKRAYIVIAILWTVALASFIAPPLSKTGFTYYQYDKDEIMCGLYWEYKWFCVITAAYIPLLSGSILVSTNVKIIKTLSSRRKKLGRMTCRRASHRHGMSAVKLLISTSSVYFFAWGPYVTEVLLTCFFEGVYIPSLVKFSFMWLANSNSFMNVITFSVVYKSFRYELKRLVVKVLCCPIRYLELCRKEEYTSTETAYEPANDLRNLHTKNTEGSSNIPSGLAAL